MNNNFLIIFLILLKTCCANVERLLVDSLFSTYDKEARPVRDNSTVITVDVDYWFINLQDVLEKGQRMSAFGWIQMVWTDEYLQWDMNEYNLSYIVVNVKDIWYPDFVIRNSADSIYGDILDHKKYRVPIYSNGSVSYYTAGQTTTFCSLDTRYFPFDVQACYIHVDSWTYADTQVKMNTTTGFKGNLYQGNGVWDIQSFRHELQSEENHGDVYSSIKFIVHIKRKPVYYMTNLIIPCCLMSVIVLFVFLLPADADEKISLSITVVLSFNVFQLLISDNMPETSEYIPLITLYITFVMVLSALSLFCTIIVLMTHHHDVHIPPPRWLKKFALQWMAFLLCTRSKLVPCCGRKKNENIELSNSDIYEKEQNVIEDVRNDLKNYNSDNYAESSVDDFLSDRWFNDRPQASNAIYDEYAPQNGSFTDGCMENMETADDTRKSSDRIFETNIDVSDSDIPMQNHSKDILLTHPNTSHRINEHNRIEALDDHPAASTSTYQQPATQYSEKKQRLKATKKENFEAEKSEKMQMTSIFQLVTASLARINSEKKAEEVKKEWEDIALVLDRVFLLLFTLVTVFVAMALLGFMPMFGPDYVENPTKVS